jgi:hypothetical protein
MPHFLTLREAISLMASGSEDVFDQLSRNERDAAWREILKQARRGTVKVFGRLNGEFKEITADTFLSDFECRAAANSIISGPLTVDSVDERTPPLSYLIAGAMNYGAIDAMGRTKKEHHSFSGVMLDADSLRKALRSARVPSTSTDEKLFRDWLQRQVASSPSRRLFKKAEAPVLFKEETARGISGNAVDRAWPQVTANYPAWKSGRPPKKHLAD